MDGVEHAGPEETLGQEQQKAIAIEDVAVARDQVKRGADHDAEQLGQCVEPQKAVTAQPDQGQADQQGCGEILEAEIGTG